MGVLKKIAIGAAIAFWLVTGAIMIANGTWACGGCDSMSLLDR